MAGSEQDNQKIFKHFHHVSLAVSDAEKVMEKWSSLFGITNWTYDDLGGTDAKGRTWKAREYHAQMGPINIDLVQPVEGRIVQSRFLETFGPGIHHICFEVDDLEKTLADFVAQGAEVVVHDPGNFAYFRSGGPDGVIFEIIERRQ